MADFATSAFESEKLALSWTTLRGPTHQLAVRMRVDYTLSNALCASAQLVLPLELSSLSLQYRVTVSVRYIQVPLACLRAVVSVASTYCVAHADGSPLPRLCSRIVHRTHICAEGFALWCFSLCPAVVHLPSILSVCCRPFLIISEWEVGVYMGKLT